MGVTRRGRTFSGDVCCFSSFGELRWHCMVCRFDQLFKSRENPTTKQCDAKFSPRTGKRTKVSCTSRIPANVSGTSRFQRKTQARELCVFTFSRLLLARHDLLRKVGLGFEPECAGTKLGHSGESGGRSTEDPHFVKREAELQRRMSPSSQHTAVTSRATDCLDNGID